jgi:hypothetical protein
MLSGLGADWRLFQKLDLPAHFEIVHIEWIAPYKNEPLIEYAWRLSAQMDTTKPFRLIGLSFGGIVATELTKLILPVQTIIVSSTAVSSGIPWYYKIGGKLAIPDLTPNAFIKSANPLSYWLFGTKTKEEKRLLKQVLHDMDNTFMNWAIKKVTTWHNTEKPANLFHIHGAADKVLPCAFVKPDVIIPHGEHLMVFSMWETVSKVISDKLNGF